MEREPFYINLKDKQLVMHAGRVGVALFFGTHEKPNEPDKDYIDIIHEPETDDPDEPEAHTWIFNNRELAIWLAGIAIREADRKILQLAERQHGSFYSLSGWRPTVIVEEEATEMENELYAQSLMNDLNNTYYVPPEFEGEDDDKNGAS